MSRRGPVLSLLALLAQGCVTLGQTKPPTEYRAEGYNAEENAPYARAGTSTITGQAFLKTRGGDVKYAAGETVYLMPGTAYAREIYTKSFQRGIQLLPAVDERHSATVRITTSDGEGRFKFSSLPAGTYYLAVDVFWEIPRSGKMQRTGGVAIAEVRIGEGETMDVIATSPGRKFGY